MAVATRCLGFASALRLLGWAFSATSGKEDKPENYALVTWELHAKDGATLATISQDGIGDDKGVEPSKANWKLVLEGLKKTVKP